MTTSHKQIGSNSLRRLAMVGGLLISVFVLGVCTQMVQPVFAAAAVAVKGGAKVWIANFAFTPGEITIAPGETVTWTYDDGVPDRLEYHGSVKGRDLLMPGRRFSRKCDQLGTPDYKCWA